MPSTSPKFTVALLDSKIHDRAAFSCGEPSLDDYLKRRASQDLKRRLAVTYVLAPCDEPARVAGYFTLSAYAVLASELPEELAACLPRHDRFPTTLIGRLARDGAYRGDRLGELLLLEALTRALENSDRVASFAVVVDALNDQAAAFYQRYGFLPFADDARRLYLPMATVKTLLS